MKKVALPIAVAFIITTVSGYLLLNRNQNAPTESTSNITLPAPDLSTAVVASELQYPWDIAITPDGTLFFTERNGSINTLKDGNKELIHTVDTVSAVGESGLMGLDIDQDFDANMFIYACYSTESDIRVARWRVADDIQSLIEQKIIVTDIPLNTTTFPGRHSGCRVKSGPDGNVWITTGDAAQSTNPQNPQSLGGKILRVNRDGEPVEGNLEEPFDPRIYSYGHRNVQGLAFDYEASFDDVVGYSVEHGTSRDDEVNPLANGNFGWEPGAGYDESAPMTDTNAFPDAIRPLWASGASTIAPSGATVISGSQWGAYEGQLAVAVLKDQHVRLFNIQLDMNETILFKNEFGRLRTIVQSPNGDLYLATSNGNNQDRIIKVVAN